MAVAGETLTTSTSRPWRRKSPAWAATQTGVTEPLTAERGTWSERTGGTVGSAPGAVLAGADKTAAGAAGLDPPAVGSLGAGAAQPTSPSSSAASRRAGAARRIAVRTFGLPGQPTW